MLRSSLKHQLGTAAARLRLMQAAVPLAVGAASFLSAAAASAAEMQGSTNVTADALHKREVRAELQAMLRAELAAPDLRSAKFRKHYVLSASVVRLESAFSRDSVRATCVVSVLLLASNGATLYAVIRGHATTEDERAHAGEVRSDALRAALHSAISRVPEVLR